MFDSAFFSRQFSDLADEFSALSRGAEFRSDDDARPFAIKAMELRTRGGGLLIDASRRGILPEIAGLGERIDWHTAEEDRPPQTEGLRLCRCPGNLFWETAGNHQLQAVRTDGEWKIVGAEPRGVLPVAFPELLPAPQLLPTWPAESEGERQTIHRFFEQFGYANSAGACRLLAELFERPKAADGPFGTDAFRWQQSVHRGLRGQVFRLLEYLWAQTDRAADFASLAIPVFRDHAIEPDANSVGSLRRDANRFFARAKIPLSVRIRGNRVELLTGEPT